MRKTFQSLIPWALSAFAAGWAQGAEAQPTAPPPAAVQHSETVVAAPPPVPRQTLANVTAGATINAGNTESYVGNLGGRLQWIGEPHQLTLELLGTYGRAKDQSTGKLQDTTKSIIGRARYDLFLSRMDALFLAVQPRSDKFAGLDLRLQNQAGYLRNIFFPADNHRFWTELGYDFTYDRIAKITTNTPYTFSGMGTDVAPTLPEGVTGTYTKSVTTPAKNDGVHSARVFFGYTNRLSPLANINLGAETLYDFQDKKNVRVNGLGEINTSVSASFKLGVQSRVLFDNVPVPGKKKTDAIITLQLVYTFDSLANQPKPPACPACDCTAQVEEERARCKSEPLENATNAPVAAPGEDAVPAAAAPSAPAEPAASAVPAAAPDAPAP